MSAIGRRFAIAVAVAVAGQVTAIAADITPPSEKQSPRGVAEFADEFADAEHSEKPLVAWLHPFTQHIASRRTTFRSKTYDQYVDSLNRLRLMHGTIARRPEVYLEEEIDLAVMQPTAIERLIAQGYGTGHGRGAGERFRIERRPDISNHLAN